MQALVRPSLVVLPLLVVLVVGCSSTEARGPDELHVDVRLDREGMTVERILASGPGVRMEGRGTVGPDGRLDLVLGAEVLPVLSLRAVPFIGPLWARIRGTALWRVEVRGSLEEPVVRAVPVPLLVSPWLRLLEGDG